MTDRVAALPMYDLPELRAETDAFWTGLARHLSRAGVDRLPAPLTRPGDLREVWHDPHLLFGQGCGFPYTQSYRDRWQLIATPCYAAAGCAGPTYRSRILVAADAPATSLAELVGGVAAVNSADSHSGHIALRAAMASVTPAGTPAFGEAVVTGGHLASARAVAEGRAQVCAVDCVTHALAERHAPARLAGTRTLAWTPSAPALPWIAGAAIDADTLARVRDGLFAALSDPEIADARAALLIDGAERLDDTAYDRIQALAEQGRPAAFL
jgi:ABC-type phosphate/phosphonate transport system substrate-binding protein